MLFRSVNFFSYLNLNFTVVKTVLYTTVLLLLSQTVFAVDVGNHVKFRLHLMVLD